MTRDKAEPELIVEQHVDDRIGAMITTNRRGGLVEQTLSFAAAARAANVDRKSLRQELKENREAICDHLERQSIPTSRAPVHVSVGGAPFRPILESETPDALFATAPVETRRWESIARDRTR